MTETLMERITRLPMKMVDGWFHYKSQDVCDIVRQHEAAQESVAEALRLANIEFSHLKAQRVFRDNGSVDRAWQAVKEAIAAMGDGSATVAPVSEETVQPIIPATDQPDGITHGHLDQLATAIRLAAHPTRAFTANESFKCARAAYEFFRPYLRSTVRAIGNDEPWRPIHTAPKDGRKIKLLADDGITSSIGEWDKNGDSWADENGDPCPAGLGSIQVTGVWASGGGWFQPNEVIGWKPATQIEGQKP